MSVESDISYVYEKVFLKVYQKRKGKIDVIYKEDYIPLNLSNKQLNILRKMCKAQGIKLEEYEYRLPSIEDEVLFNEYNEIKQTIAKSLVEEEKHPLNARRIEIRNKIVMDNLALVRDIIDRNYDGIQELPNKEDIYHLGYQLLLKYVESGIILRPRYFTHYISSKLISDIKEQIQYSEKGINQEQKNLLKKIRKARNNHISDNPDSRQLSRTLNIEQSKVEEYLNLERLLESISVDDEIEKITDNLEENHENSPLYNNTFEANLIKKTVREILLKLIYTLPQQQIEVVLLAYGFKDGRCYDDVEISKMFGVTNARIGKIRHEAIKNLSLSIRKKYLQDYYNVQNFEVTEDSDKKLQALEEVLIEYIPQKELLEYINNIPAKERELLMLKYGLKDGIKYSNQGIADKIGYSLSHVFIIRKKAFKSLQNIILKSHIKNCDLTTITYQEYISYLMDKYMTRNPKQRKK